MTPPIATLFSPPMSPPSSVLSVPSVVKSHLPFSMALSVAQAASARIVEVLRPHCEQIEVAGSVRRQKPEGIRDLDIVCTPLASSSWGRALGTWNGSFLRAVRECDRWELGSKLTPESRQVKLISRRDARLKIELWLSPPDRYGWTLLLRTGPHDFNCELMARLPSLAGGGYSSIDGDLAFRGKPVPAVGEMQVFDLLGIPYIVPQDRTAAALRAVLGGTGFGGTGLRPVTRDASGTEAIS